MNNSDENTVDARGWIDLQKKFHFQELNWIITFPNSGNTGKKYPEYSVSLSDFKSACLNEKVRLIDIVEKLEFEKFPYTVGFFKSETNESPRRELKYLELRTVRSVEDFWKFLNDLDL